jgi:hypothetical protein
MSNTAGLLWSILLLTVVGVGALLIFTVAWAYRKRNRTETFSGAFTLQDLREMRDSGAISEVEYETMRAAVLAQARGQDDAAAESAGPPTPPDDESREDGPTDDNIRP